MKKEVEKAIRKRMQKLAFDANIARRWPETAYPYAFKALAEYEALKKELGPQINTDEHR